MEGRDRTHAARYVDHLFDKSASLDLAIRVTRDQRAAAAKRGLTCRVKSNMLFWRRIVVACFEKLRTHVPCVHGMQLCSC